MKLRLYDVTVVVSVALEAGLEKEKAERDAREVAYGILHDDLYSMVQDADVEATDEYGEQED